MLPTPLDLSQRSSRAAAISTSSYDDNEHDEEQHEPPQKQSNSGEHLMNKLIEKKYIEMRQKNFSSTASLKGIIFFSSGLFLFYASCM